jgi:choline dehydrogenase
MKKDISRRDFVKKSAEAGIKVAAAATALGAIAGCATHVAGSISRAITSTDNEYEFIVVGSGAGGGPLAANLARAGFRVLLLEAGNKPKGPNYFVPAFNGKSTEDPQMSWHYFVNHYKDAIRRERDTKFIKDKNGILYPRAGALGGCTAHNAMITLFPENSDWDRMAVLTGDHSWRAQAMYQHFAKVEKATYMSALLSSETDIALRNRGWLNLEQNDVKLGFKDIRLLREVFSAARESGLVSESWIKLIEETGNLQLDPNDPAHLEVKHDGLYSIPKSTRMGTRQGSKERLMQVQREFPDKLIIKTGALVTKVLFDDNDKKLAIGVEYLEGEHLYRADVSVNEEKAKSAIKREAFARHEVILAGGAFNSPQLLMLSGIGDTEELERHKIAVRHHLPGVGKNLQDRYEVGVVSELDGGDIKVIKDCTFGEPEDPCLKEYMRNPAVARYATNGVVISYIKRSPNASEPDLVIFGLPGYFKGYYPGWSKESLKKNHFTWAILKGHTSNTAGVVKLKSSDPRDTPEINFHYFDHGNGSFSEDLDAVLSGVKTARSINKRLGFSHERIPGPLIKSDGQVRDFILNEAWGHHASCSNKMGLENDPMAVVDSKFRVHGIKNLRVVDASVFPRIPGLFIVASVYTISEKASLDLIHAARKS